MPPNQDCQLCLTAQKFITARKNGLFRISKEGGKDLGKALKAAQGARPVTVVAENLIGRNMALALPSGRVIYHLWRGIVMPGRQMWTVVLLSLCFPRPVLPVMTRQAASLHNEAKRDCCPGDGMLPFLAETGRTARIGADQRLGDECPAVQKPWERDTTKNFWGDNGSRVVEEVVVRRAGLASKRAKHPRKVVSALQPQAPEVFSRIPRSHALSIPAILA